ncbi:hypothetical protein K7432_016288 [Basidiobolus ranarum]|uniref:Uncharacterized protein n=1 Tax=Basidiobolus ranarum TaxID=34480 RepID=A0ABR2WEY4_9FUNG
MVPGENEAEAPVAVTVPGENETEAPAAVMVPVANEAEAPAAVTMPITNEIINTLGLRISHSRQACLGCPNAIPLQSSLSRQDILNLPRQKVADKNHLTLEQMFDWSELRNPMVWRSGICECVLMMWYVLMSCGVIVWSIRIGGPVVSLNIGLGTFAVQSILAIAATATPGIQMNTMATWTTVGARLCSVPLGIVHTVMQCIGAIIAGAVLRVSCGHMVAEATKLGSWGYDEEVVTMGQAFCLEFFYSWSYAWLTLLIGLDPKQRKVYGPAIPACCVALSLGLNIFVSGGLNTGYIGVGANPGKYLGVAVASGNYQQFWIPWFAPMCASIVQSSLYWKISPFHEMAKS